MTIGSVPNQNQIFPRLNLTACEPYTDRIRSWCDTGDVYCDRGNNTRIHGSYFTNYTDVAVDFIVGKYKVSLAETTGTGTGTTPTPTPTPTPGAANPGSAAGLRNAGVPDVAMMGLVLLGTVAFGSMGF